MTTLLIILPFVAFICGILFDQIGMPSISFVANRIVAKDEIHKGQENLIITKYNIELTEMRNETEPVVSSAIGYEVDSTDLDIHTLEDGSQYIEVDEDQCKLNSIGFTRL